MSNSNLNVLFRLNSTESKKRKFVPNIAKALNKQNKGDESLHKPKSGDRQKSDDRSQMKSARLNNPHSVAPKGKPQFIQSYSIFESGVGCVVKNEKRVVEMCESRSSCAPQTQTIEVAETECKLDPITQCESFVTDIKQVFKNVPAVMVDSASGNQSHIDPLTCMDLSSGQCARNTCNFFSDFGQGKLFTLQLPDKLLNADFKEIKEGWFGKIQLLDNNKACLVVGESTFDLISPRPLCLASDVVIVNSENKEHCTADCVGHLDQTMMAVPNLDDFVRFGT